MDLGIIEASPGGISMKKLIHGMRTRAIELMLFFLLLFLSGAPSAKACECSSACNHCKLDHINDSSLCPGWLGLYHSLVSQGVAISSCYRTPACQQSLVRCYTNKCHQPGRAGRRGGSQHIVGCAMDFGRAIPPSTVQQQINKLRLSNQISTIGSHGGFPKGHHYQRAGAARAKTYRSPPELTGNTNSGGSTNRGFACTVLGLGC